MHGVYDGKTWPLAGAGARVGRAPGCELELDYDQFVSGQHARLARQGERWAIEDLDSSKNGTFVNWRRLARGRPHILRVGDLVSVGRSRLLYLE